jgi:exopolysaccharide biosynthesis polyprenyl glycosylphosphotransferase
MLARAGGLGAPGAALLAAVAAADGDWALVLAIVLAGFGLAGLICRPVDGHMALLSFMGSVRPVFGAVLGSAGLAALPPGGWSVAELLLLPAAAWLGSRLVDRPLHRAGCKVRRIALVGPDATAQAMARELGDNGVTRFELVGRITADPAEAPGLMPTLGGLDTIAHAVVAHRVDLLVLSPEIPRLPVFEQLAASCLDLPVRLVDLNSFCERVFGHVPVRSINGAWFQYLMHPRFRHRRSAVKRVLDFTIAGVAAIVFLPVLVVAAVLVRLDGGPALFAQTRIGDGGRPFRIFKLRTMVVADGPSRWTGADDDRVTRVGRLLRRTHLDEVPQVFNVLRGDMSIVGPRPEQPMYVESLEATVPYYSRRHLIKPGITGWAQVRCGYAGSVEGSAWKLCHDLYYVKHRSLGLDLVILGETVRTLFADRQYPGGIVPSGTVATTPAASINDTEGVLAAW